MRARSAHRYEEANQLLQHHNLADQETHDLYGAETAEGTLISRFAERGSENNSQRYGICSFASTRTK